MAQFSDNWHEPKDRFHGNLLSVIPVNPFDDIDESNVYDMPANTNVAPVLAGIEEGINKIKRLGFENVYGVFITPGGCECIPS
jgi:hypothetical protein